MEESNSNLIGPSPDAVIWCHDPAGIKMASPDDTSLREVLLRQGFDSSREHYSYLKCL